eukprot:SAG11_NODE_10076_length_857_cov_5.174142_1_plen_116_part_00
MSAPASARRRPARPATPNTAIRPRVSKRHVFHRHGRPPTKRQVRNDDTFLDSYNDDEEQDDEDDSEDEKDGDNQQEDQEEENQDEEDQGEEPDQDELAYLTRSIRMRATAGTFVK